MFYVKEVFSGQSFCFRTMITSFMVEASKVLSFEDVGNNSTSNKHSLEWWVFRPQENGKQVGISSKILIIKRLCAD